MATNLLEPTTKGQTPVQPVQQPAPAVDAAAAVSKAAHIVSTPQAPAIATPPGEASPDLRAWMAGGAQRSCAGAGEALLWLLAMVTFLAITSAGIWMNATATFPHF
jgi:hypothetical protein